MREQKAETKERGGVYIIRNLSTDHFYIGSSKNVRRRLVDHKRALEAGTHHNSHLQRAWNKYKAADFILVMCCRLPAEEALAIEEELLQRLAGDARSYNMRGATTCHHSAEARAKISAAHKGKKRPPEVIEKGAAKRRGRPLPPSVGQAVAAANRRRVVSQETRAKMRQRMSQQSADQRAAVSLAHKGKPKSLESRAKMRASALQLWAKRKRDRLARGAGPVTQDRTCKTCGNVFRVLASKLRARIKHFGEGAYSFCSAACRIQGSTSPLVARSCATCGTVFHLSAKKLRSNIARRGEGACRYCSPSCRANRPRVHNP